MSNIMIPVVQYHHCKKCNNTHEYVIDKNFLAKLARPLQVRCAVCGEIRKQIMPRPVYHD